MQSNSMKWNNNTGAPSLCYKPEVNVYSFAYQTVQEVIHERNIKRQKTIINAGQSWFPSILIENVFANRHEIGRKFLNEEALSRQRYGNN